MLIGIACALAAGIVWGITFVGPLLLPEYPAFLQACGRYFAFGLIALPLGWLDRRELARLARSDWLEAFKLAAVGNLIYYFFLASAIQEAGGPLPTMIMGLLPVVISITANLINQDDDYLPWAKLLPSLGVIFTGIACVNQTELSSLSLHPKADILRYVCGALLAVSALICWTWYPIRNSKWLRANPDRNPRAWATAQGLATLPLAFVGYILFIGFSVATESPLPLPFGTRPLLFIGVMMAIGFLASWLGTLLWNEASQRLPTALAGQLLSFQTLTGLSYAYLLRQQWPESLTLVGIFLMLIGVLWSTKIKPKRRAVAAV
jgi:drug/metabolite transporter (DMT)-like permease